MVLNTQGAVQVKIVVKLRGQHIACRKYTRAQTTWRLEILLAKNITSEHETMHVQCLEQILEMYSDEAVYCQTFCHSKECINRKWKL